MGYLIQDTTREERERIVAESLGNISAACDGCSAGIAEMYSIFAAKDFPKRRGLLIQVRRLGVSMVWLINPIRPDLST